MKPTTKRRPWTAKERSYLVRHHETKTAAQIGKALGRTEKAVWLMKISMGLTKRHHYLTEANKQTLLALHAKGWSDAEIAAHIGCERHTVGDWRKRLNLPHNAYSAHRRQRVAAKTQQQLSALGLRSLAELRVAVFRQRAREAGWPENLRPRAVQMLNALWERGPMTRRELADAIGLPWRGSRSSLKSNDPGGTYLTHLMRLGLVIQLPKAVRRGGKGNNVTLYSLPLWIDRNSSSNNGNVNQQGDSINGNANVQGTANRPRNGQLDAHTSRGRLQRGQRRRRA